MLQFDILNTKTGNNSTTISDIFVFSWTKKIQWNNVIIQCWCFI